jgi:hypothetical protein
MHLKLTKCALVALFVAIGSLAAASPAVAQGIDTTNPNLPPAGAYTTAGTDHAEYLGPGIDIVLSEVQHLPLPGTATHTPINGGTDDLEHFDSQVTGFVSFNGVAAQPVSGAGPVSVIVSGYSPGNTGTFNTQMTQLDLALSLPGVLIRVDPVQPSLGQTDIAPLGGGQFHISSFFDVFTDLSLDGGNTWIPSPLPTRVTLSPEPSSIVLGLFGAASLGLVAIRKRRGRRSA